MKLETFINELLNITECREQFMTKVYFKSEYYEIVVQRLDIEKIGLEDGFIKILFNNGRRFKLKITEDLKYWTKTSLI